MARFHDEERHPLSERSIEQENQMLLRRYREFRRGADAVTEAWRTHSKVIAVSLIGSVARAPWKEVPRFAPYRRARVALWHECKDVDLALCRVPGCGEVTLLRQHEGFRWRSESLAEERSVRLFDRAAKLHRRAADPSLFESPMRGDEAHDGPWGE